MKYLFSDVKIGDIDFQKYHQKVKVADKNDIDVVVEFIGENYVDIVEKDDFIENFRKVENE
jgi:hypothetical protein